MKKLEPFYAIEQVLGIQVDFRAEDLLHIRACQLHIRQQLLDIEKQVSGLTELGELPKEFPGVSYCAINLSGRGVLHKQVPRLKTLDKASFGQLLPNASPDDFYIQHFDSGESSFISLIRKDLADRWLSAVRQLGFIPLLLTLGPFAVHTIQEQLNLYDGQLLFDGHLIERDAEHGWLSYQYNAGAKAAFPLKVGGENISEELLVAYATAFELALGHQLEVVKAVVPELETAFEKVLADRKFKVQGILVLCIFFVILLVNFLTFSWLESANKLLSSKVDQTTQDGSTLRRLAAEAGRKEALVDSLGWDGGINKSLLVDQLAALLPAEVKWRELTINRLDWTGGSFQRKLIFADRQIRVTGQSAEIIPVNEWLARVKSLRWVKSAQLDRYMFNAEEKSGQFVVIINF